MAGALYDLAGTGRAALWMAAAVAMATVPVLWLFRKAMLKSNGVEPVAAPGKS